MTYNTLESATRNAVCNTLGAKSENFDAWLNTCDPDEGLEVEGFDFGTTVELSFDPSVSPFSYFSSDVVFYVNVDENRGTGNVQAFFGSSCYDMDAAEVAAESFLDRDEADGWFVGDEFDEVSGLHLVRTFSVDPDNYADIFSKITTCFAELCGSEISDKLRSFIHYFEDEL